MGIEKQGSRGGNYVGGFLQMFDWNVKSRKKLFSSKSDVPELSKQKKRCDGNLPMTRLQMMDVDEIAAGPSIRESSDYSCASSVTDEDYTGAKAPGVVARLMGLDSLPKSNMPEHYSTLFDSQSLQDVYYRNKNREYFQDQMMHSGSLKNVPNWNGVEPKSQKVIHRPIEKFQSEVLPPKSAKTIPITHHKLLSPIKSSNFNPSKDAAHIMEAAARIIERGPQASKKTKLPPVGSSSGPLRIRDLREKVQASQKPSKVFEISQKKSESTAINNLRGPELSMNRSCNGSLDGTSMRVTPDSDESSVAVKSRAKSISLALQAKANVQKRERLNVYSSTSVISQKEPCELSPNQIFKSQSVTWKNTQKKPSIQNGSSVLRQNNQKQNCIVDRGKLPSKKGGKTHSGEYSSSSRQRSSSKLAGTSKASSRKMGSEVKDDKSEPLSSRSERITCKKRSVDGSYHSEKNQAANSMQIDQTAKSIQSSTSTDRMSSCWDQEVISFTFTSPMTRSRPGSERSTEAGESCKIFSVGSQSKRSQPSSTGMSASKFSFVGHNVKGGDALSTLLEQKLKELARKVDFSPEKSGKEIHDMVPGLEDMMSSTTQEVNKATNAISVDTDNQEVLEEMSTSESSISHARKLIDYRHPSPVSVLEYSSFANSWNSSDTGYSTSMGVAGSKQCSSNQAQELLDMCSLKTLLKIEGDTELSDSASSISNGTVAKLQKTALTDSGNPRRWELDYVKRILYNIEVMFKDYALGRTHEIINPDLFDQLESRKGNLNDGGVTSRINRRVLFDCVKECLELRCRQYVSGGCQLWAKGLSVVRRKDRLAEEVYREISGWSGVGDSMIDEIVDKDMSCQHGRWLGFDIEAFELGIQIESRILNSLMDEVLADILVL